jgi:OmcA/MtrC family decaheme c-type cytochrome
MARLALVIAGPTTDYNAFSTGYVSEDALTKSTGSNGTFTYTFTQVIPANAKGTFTVGIEGRRLETVLAGTKQERSIQYGAPNKVMFFAVDGSRMAPRRQVVTNEKCLACHTRLALHGENRVSTVEQCVLCHNPVETDKARRPAAEGAPQTVDFRWMIHRIHGGEEVTATAGTNYTVYGFGGSKNDFSNILYPARLSKCDACHVNGSENPPLPNHAPVNNQRFLLNPTPPVSAACLACHQTVDAASHALANTTEIGESCSACHGASAEFSVSRVHAAEVR